jgi:GNAT superfamily N-acetyltransferase
MPPFDREVFVCKCPTDIPPTAPAASGPAALLRWLRGGQADLVRLDPAHHGEEQRNQMRVRLEHGRYWLIGEVDGRIATFSWLHNDDRTTYPFLPGCEIRLREDTGYGYEAWTHPDFRNHGLRRITFAEELHTLHRTWGVRWEASVFVDRQLEGGTRSLAQVGIAVIPLWRVWIEPSGEPHVERLHDDADAAVPSFPAPAT